MGEGDSGYDYVAVFINAVHTYKFDTLFKKIEEIRIL